MDDSFSFTTSVPIRRQVDPRVVRVGVFFGVISLGIGLFANWVIASERESLVRADHRRVASDVAVTQIGGSVDPDATDADAKHGVRIALAAAEAAFTERRTFLDAGPAQLSALQPGYSFVDGPSTTPWIVSVASRDRVWAAAVRSPGGTCFWMRITASGVTERGTIRDCTGAAALTSTQKGW